MIDAIARLVPGVVGDERSVTEDSFSRGLLDFPQYTRPAELTARGVVIGPDPGGDNGSAGTLKVPDVLLSGNHAEIRRWRKREALSRTLDRRPDLLSGASLDAEEEQILRELQKGKVGHERD
jgi:tRNA (guanine37-N1)-methyltransferase